MPPCSFNPQQTEGQALVMRARERACPRAQNQQVVEPGSEHKTSVNDPHGGERRKLIIKSAVDLILSPREGHRGGREPSGATLFKSPLDPQQSSAGPPLGSLPAPSPEDPAAPCRTPVSPATAQLLHSGCVCLNSTPLACCLLGCVSNLQCWQSQ